MNLSGLDGDSRQDILSFGYSLANGADPNAGLQFPLSYPTQLKRRARSRRSDFQKKNHRNISLGISEHHINPIVKTATQSGARQAD